jgi:RNA polymerase sigma factor (TIGR02999 family)
MAGMSNNSENQIDAARLMRDAAVGNQQASQELLPLVYRQLRAIAAQRMKLERSDHTLQPTALVHEAFLKLVGPRSTPWAGEAHFFVAAAEAMRQILVDHAKTKGREKRGGKRVREAVNLADVAAIENSDEILALEEAVCRLEQQEPDVGRIVRLRFFAGLGIDQIAELLQIAPRTVDRRWQFARAWLFRELADDSTSSLAQS